MIRSVNFRPFALFALFVSSLFLLGYVGSNVPDAKESLLASPSAAGVNGNSGITWGADIIVSSGPSIETNTRRKDHVIDVDPTNPDHLTGAYTQIEVGYDSKFANSTDGGLTWSRGTITNFLEYGSGGSVSFGFDGHGTGYYSSLAITDTGSAILVYTTTTGTTWSDPLPASVYTNTEYRFLPMLAVDKRTSGQYAGTPYLFYENYETQEPFYLGIWSKYSRDGGVTWADEVRVSDPGHLYVHGPSAVVASDGTIYAAFEYRPTGAIGETPELYLDRSTDGGATWGMDRLISGAPIRASGAPDWKVLELTLPVVQGETCNMIRINHYPSIAVSPTDPNVVYATWNDGRWDTSYPGCSPGTGNHADIAFSRTTDGGLTWSTARRINDDTKGNGIDQFMPTIEVSPSGVVGIAYYDRRYDPNNVLYDLSYNESTDGGATWSPTQRVSDVSSDPDRLVDLKGIDDIGIRKSLVYGNDYALPSWIDTRLGTQQGEFFVDHGVAATAIPSATATASGTPTRTSTSVQPSATPTACTVQFEDVPNGSTFYAFVHCLACRSIIAGYACGGAGEPCVAPGNLPYFRPASTITRAQLAKVVSNAAGFSDPVSGQQFEDIPPGSTFYDFVGRLASRGVMSGYACGGAGEPCVAPGNLPYFRPNANATRGQISKIVALSANIADPPGIRRFEDVVEGSTFYTYTQQLANLNVMSGYPCNNPEPCVPPDNRPYFRPNNNATRGQVSKIVSNTFFPNCTP